ncbi:MAG: hypothetical protein V4633_19080 [Pseudomonadota bacterium]
MLLKRLRSHARLTAGFAIIGALAAECATALEWMDRYERSGWGHIANRLPRDLMATLVGAMVIILALRMCTERAGDLVRRPLKFLGLLVLIVALGASIGWCALVLMSSGRLPINAGAEKFYDIWMQGMLWGGMVGWMYLLSLQRAESHATLAGLLGQRVLLARQLARSRLGTARAQFDPAMVARVLSEVHERYRNDPADASALLDQLISYLRLAMNRARDERPDAAAEEALGAALSALQRAEQHQGEPAYVADQTVR